MEPTINQLHKKAITAHQEGKLEEAEKLYKKILETEPTHPATHNNVGVLLYGLGRLEEAVVHYKKAIEFKPDYQDAHNNLGIIMQRLGRFLEAEIIYKKIIELNPDFAEAHNNLGIIFNKLNKPDEAEAIFKKAIELKPEYLEPYYNLGITLQNLERLDEAEVYYKKAIEINPDYSRSHYNLGNLYDKLERHEEAEKSYKKSTELEPNFAQGHYNLGTMMQKLGKWDDSIFSCKKAIELKSDFTVAHNNLGVGLKELNRLSEAEACFTKAIELSPNFKGALINRGQVLFNKGEFERALQDFDTCNNSESKSRSLYTLHALGRTKDIYKRIEINSELEDQNIAVAAFSAFISKKESKITAHKFCNNPLDFIKVSNLSSHLKDKSLFISEMIEELHKVKTKWEPSGKTTKKGFQSIDNLFDNSSEKIQNLKSIIIDEIDSYYLKFKNESCSFIKKWPSKKNLRGWHVTLKQQGYQDPHIHTSGWLSGVIYLKVVPTLDKNEGAIQFSLNGEYYFDNNSPKITHEPKVGDIILFPSSLHHRTIPFTTDTDRIIVSFDLMPNTKKIK
tara:strand:- start:73 stop:1761 length:1689 start_codon:yes stop_codon:yes gene_type:complete